MADCFVHPKALCETKKIGAGTRVGAFACVLEGAIVGRDCNICSHTYIGAGAALGDRVTINNGVHVWDGIRLEDDVFIGPNATFTNDIVQRKIGAETSPETRVCQGALIGANATILPGVTIGRNALVGAGAVVTRSVPPNAVVMGNPARIRGYVAAMAQAGFDPSAAEAGRVSDRGEVGVQRSAVSGVTLHRLPLRRDMRGSLVASEFGEDIPFDPKRSFLVFDVSSSEIRGEHAHYSCHQFIVCVRGGCSVLVDDGRTREEFRLDHPTLGLYIPPMVWSSQFRHSPDAMLLVLASEHYDPADYIRDYQTFLDEVARVGS